MAINYNFGGLVLGPMDSFGSVQAGLPLRELSATRLIEVARCACFRPLIKSFMLLLGHRLRDFAR